MFKKVSILFVALVATILSGKSQVFVGGNMGFSSDGGKIETTGSADIVKPSEFSFSFRPFVGYQITDDFSAGVKIGFNTESEKWQVPETSGFGTVERKESDFLWDFGVFGRYSVWQHNKFSVLLEASLGIGGGTVGKVSGPNPNDGASVFGFSFAVVPGVSYNLNDRLSLETWLNVMRFSFNSTTITTKYTGSTSPTETKDTTNGFNFGVNEPWVPWNIFTTFNVGLVFKF